MRKILYAILLCAVLVVPCAARMTTVVVGGSVPAAAASYLVNEEFDGTGAPTGWSYDVSDVEGDWDFTTAPAPLSGTQSLELNGGTENAIYTLTAPTGELYISFIATVSDNTPASASYLLTLFDSGDAALARLQLRTDSTVRSLNTGGTTDSSAGTFSANDTKYWVKLRAKKGTGVDTAIVEAWFSADTVSWVSTASVSDGDWTNDISYIRFDGNAGTQIILDHVIVDDGDIPITEYQ